MAGGTLDQSIVMSGDTPGFSRQRGGNNLDVRFDFGSGKVAGLEHLSDRRIAFRILPPDVGGMDSGQGVERNDHETLSQSVTVPVGARGRTLSCRLGGPLAGRSANDAVLYQPRATPWERHPISCQGLKARAIRRAASAGFQPLA